MNTVITDRSLSTFTFNEGVSPEHIFGYISALRDAGIKYVELDFRTVLKMAELPDGIKYIFRVTDPVFMEMADAFDFDYMLVRPSDYKKRIDAQIPVIAELPVGITLSHQLERLLNFQLGSKLAMIRLRGSFPMFTPTEAAKYVAGMKTRTTVPVDFCPHNATRTALDTAIKLSITGADCLTLCMGGGAGMASIEEYVFTLMSVFGIFSDKIDMAALCRAAVFHGIIFREGRDNIAAIMRQLDRDIMGLTNVDTGKRVRMGVTLRDSGFLHKTFVSTLEKLAREENLPPDILLEMTEAIQHFGMGLYNDGLLKEKYDKDLLN